MSKGYYLVTFPGGASGAVLQEHLHAESITEPMALGRSRSQRDPGVVWAVTTIWGDPLVGFKDGATLRAQRCSSCGEVVIMRRGGMKHREAADAAACWDLSGDRAWEPVDGPTEEEADAG